MKRALLSVACVLSMAMMATQAHAGKYSVTGTKYGDSQSEHCWVLAEITGYNVFATLYTTMDDVRKRQDAVAQINADRARANRSLEDEITKLNQQLTSKSHALAAAKDDTAKSDLQKTVNDLTAQIQKKKAGWQPLIRVLDPAPFNKHADANKYIDELRTEAQAAKEKADKEAQAAKEKADKKEAEKESAPKKG